MRRLQQLGVYPLKAELSSGSLGRRFQTSVGGRPACIEMTSVRGDQELFDRSIRRIEVLATVDHPHLVPVLDMGLERDQLFVVTPEPERTADSIGSIDIAAGQVIGAIAAGLSHFHQLQWLHRDLQLRHIGWYDGTIKLGGFGLADLRGVGRTEGVGPIGGVLTMAPSLVRGAMATVGSDIYSLGAALHLLTTGEAVHPIRRESLADRICRIGSEAPTISSDFPPDLLPALRAALSVDGIDEPSPNPLRAMVDLCATKGTS